MKKTYLLLVALIFTSIAFTQFSDQIPIEIGSSLNNTLIDFDGDGDLDIFDSNHNSIFWRENSGDLSFRKIHIIYRESISEEISPCAAPFDLL